MILCITEICGFGDRQADQREAYYYLATSARVGGKARIVEQKYLGTAAEIEAAIAGATVMPSRTRHLAFGGLAAAWWVIDKLGVPEIIDEVVGDRRADAGASVGTYLALAAANRVVAPCSKLAFADWWAGTAGDHLVKVKGPALDHRRFWDAMHAVDARALAEIERSITHRVIETFGLDISSLALDMTNFATYIDSTNTAAPIAQRGEAKQKRSDPRLVGLGLVVTRDGGVPLLSHAYAGDRPDVTQFGSMIEELATRYRAVGTGTGELTVVFDAGQNSEPNFERPTDAGLGYVGSLPPSERPRLLTIPVTGYQRIDEFDGLRAHEVSGLDALGRTHRGLLTHSAELHAGQARGLDQTLAKTQRQLGKIQQVLASGRGRRTRDQLTTAIDKITNKRPQPLGPRPARHTRRHPRNRAALPRRPRPPQSPPRPHRHEPNPATALRPLRALPMDADPLGNTPHKDQHYRRPGETPTKIKLARKLRLGPAPCSFWARGSGTLMLLDVKRGDIGSTMDGYAQADLADGAPLADDAVDPKPRLRDPIRIVIPGPWCVSADSDRRPATPTNTPEGITNPPIDDLLGRASSNSPPLLRSSLLLYLSSSVLVSSEL